MRAVEFDGLRRLCAPAVPHAGTVAQRGCLSCSAARRSEAPRVCRGRPSLALIPAPAVAAPPFWTGRRKTRGQVDEVPGCPRHCRAVCEGLLYRRRPRPQVNQAQGSQHMAQSQQALRPSRRRPDWSRTRSGGGLLLLASLDLHPSPVNHGWGAFLAPLPSSSSGPMPSARASVVV